MSSDSPACHRATCCCPSAAAYRAARDLVRDNYPKLEELLEKEVFDAIVKVVGNKRGTGTPRATGPRRMSVNAIIDKMFEDVGVGGAISDIEFFRAVKAGAERMRWFIIASIKDVKDVNERKWIKFDEETQSYLYVAKGAEMPEGWDGYLPKDESLL